MSKNLLKSNYKVYLYDNIAKPEDVKISDKKGVNFCKKLSGGYLNKMDAVIIMNNHEKNEEVISKYLKKKKNNSLFFDSFFFNLTQKF